MNQLTTYIIELSVFISSIYQPALKTKKKCSNNYEIYCVRCFGFFIYTIYSSKNQMDSHKKKINRVKYHFNESIAYNDKKMIVGFVTKP